MGSAIHARAYFDFLHWMQNQYPDLYSSYWKNFDLPADGDGVQINTDKGMDVATQHLLLQKAWEFYNIEDRATGGH